MEPWTAAECIALAEAIVAAGDSFYTWRVLQRLGAGELTIEQATEVLSSIRVGRRLKPTLNLPGRGFSTDSFI